MEELTKRQQQARATKHKIFNCALALFSEKEYESITIQDICREAEVSVGAFYHHFTGKDNLLDEGYRLFDQQVEAKWEEGHPASPLEAVYFLVYQQTQSMESMGAFASMQYFKNQLSSLEKYILNPERFFYQKMLQAVEDGVKAGLLQEDAAGITEEILCVTRGIIYDWGLHGGSYSLSERTKRILHMILCFYRTEKPMAAGCQKAGFQGL